MFVNFAGVSLLIQVFGREDFQHLDQPQTLLKSPEFSGDSAIETEVKLKMLLARPAVLDAGKMRGMTQFDAV